MGNVCPENLTVYVPAGKSYLGGPMKETGTHIADALGNGIPNPTVRSAWFYPAFSPSGKAARDRGYAQDWYDTDPRFNTNQAVNLTLPDGSLVASVKPVPREEQFPRSRTSVGSIRIAGCTKATISSCCR